MVGDRQLCVGELSTPRFILDIEAGSTCTPLGDLDGDGCVDLRVTRFPVRPEGSIASSLVSGRSGAILWSILESHGYPGPACRIPDTDADGADDIALADSTTQVRVVSGRDGTLLRSLPRYVDPDGSLETLGDFDGDGKADLLQQKGWSEPVQILCATDGGLLGSVPGRPDVVHSPGDVDGDGTADIVCSDDTLRIFSGVDASDLLCEALGSAGGGRADWNGDGCDDVLVNQNLKIPNPEDAPPDLWRKGKIEILSGKDGSILKTFDESVLPPLR